MEIKRLLLAEVKPSVKNPRKTFPQKDIEELAESIRQHGLIQPIVVGLKDSDGYFPLIAGERRYRALKMLEEAEVSCVIRKESEPDFLSVVENLQRQDIPPHEEAEALWALKSQGRDEMEIAAMIGKSAGFVRSRISLATHLSDSFKALLASGELPVSYAVQLARLSDQGQEKAYSILVREYTVQNSDGEKTAKIAVGGKDRLSSAIRAASSSKLLNAPFSLKDADTFASAGGACNVCPKRTRHSALFQESIGSQDLCLDGHCFQQKVEIHYQREKEKLGEPTAKVASMAFNMPHPASAKPFSYYTGYTFIEPSSCGAPQPIMYIGEGDFEPYIKYICGCNGKCTAGAQEKAEIHKTGKAEADERLSEAEDLPFSEEIEELEQVKQADKEEASSGEVANTEDKDPFLPYQIFAENISIEPKALPAMLAFAIYDNQFLECVKAMDWLNADGTLKAKKMVLQMEECLAMANRYIQEHGIELSMELLYTVYFQKLGKYENAKKAIIDEYSK